MVTPRIPARKPDELKTLKVNIPVRLHSSLHQMRLIHKQSMQDTVTIALDRYFAKIELAAQ